MRSGRGEDAGGLGGERGTGGRRHLAQGAPLMLSPQRGGVLESIVFYQMRAGGTWGAGKECRMSPASLSPSVPWSADL